MDSKNIFKLAIGVLIVVIVLRMVSCKYGSGGSKSSYEMYEDQENFADYDPMEMSDDQETFKAANPSVSPTMPPMSASVDLLPKPTTGSTDFGEFAPRNLGSQNFLDASKLIGVDTIGSSLKNSNYSIRADPPIIRKDIGPWAQSSIEADLYRKNVLC